MNWYYVLWFVIGVLVGAAAVVGREFYLYLQDRNHVGEFEDLETIYPPFWRS